MKRYGAVESCEPVKDHLELRNGMADAASAFLILFTGQDSVIFVK